ncbi:tetratricopeptide repeat protein [Salinispirillum marinum]|uniref:Tetratricopeptide repeat protein n=2 Tax=Saccharospirillaceae TaxID=255527 RepID=A0ABV8BF48_9GAMM
MTGEVFFRVVLAELAARNNEPEVALELYDAALSDYPNNLDLIARVAPLAIQLGQIEAATYYYDRWTELEPTNLEAWHGAWQLNLGLQRIDPAVEALESLLAQQADFALFVPFDLIQGWPPAQQQALRQALLAADLPAAQSSDLTLINGYLAETQGDQRAAALLWRALDGQLRAPQAYQAYGETLLDLSLWQGAEVVLTSAIQQFPDVDRFYLLRAQSFLAQQQQAEAFAVLLQGLEQLPDNSRLLRFSGELAYAQNDPRAEAFFTQLLDTDQHSIARFYLGRLAEDRGDMTAAYEAYLQVTDPEWAPRAIQRQLQILAEHSIPGVNIDELFAQHQLYFADIRYQIAELHGRFWFDREDYERAFAAFSLGLEDQPQDTTLLYLRALSAEPLDRLDVLEADLNAILAQEPDNAAALNALGYTLVDRTDRFAEARPLIERAYELNPDSAAITDSLGWLYFKEGQFDEAETYLRLALDLQGWDEDDDEIVAHYVEAIWRGGDRARALSIAADWLERHQNTQRLEAIVDLIHETP